MENERFVVFYMGTLVVFNTNSPFIKKMFCTLLHQSSIYYRLKVKFIALAVNFSKFELNLEEKW